MKNAKDIVGYIHDLLFIAEKDKEAGRRKVLNIFIFPRALSACVLHPSHFVLMVITNTRVFDFLLESRETTVRRMNVLVMYGWGNIYCHGSMITNNGDTQIFDFDLEEICSKVIKYKHKITLNIIEDYFNSVIPDIVISLGSLAVCFSLWKYQVC